MNSDCSYKHFISYKERKIVKRFYDAISSKTIDEPNMDTRKKNCTYGQLCENKECGYKHRLSFADREKLIVSYKFNKICPENVQVAKTSNSKSDKLQLNIQNTYSLLNDDDEIVEVLEDLKITTNPVKSTWASIVKNDKPIKVLPKTNNVPLNWEDCADDDFLMTFD
jgi:hypothetical protein